MTKQDSLTQSLIRVLNWFHANSGAGKDEYAKFLNGTHGFVQSGHFSRMPTCNLFLGFVIRDLELDLFPDNDTYLQAVKNACEIELERIGAGKPDSFVMEDDGDE